MFFAKLHPLLVHFPMALLFSGTLFQLFGRLQQESVTLEAGAFNIRFGFWTAPIVMIIGGLALPSIRAEGLAENFLNSHIQYAFLTILVFSIYLAVHRYRGKWWADIIHYLSLVTGLVLIFLTGFYGGELVHRFGLPN